MGWAHHAVPALEFGQRGSSRELEPMGYWLEGDTQKRWSKANLQISIELAAVAMGNKSKPELKLMPMRSDERLAQRIAEELLPRYEASSILDIGCGDAVVSEYLTKGCSYQGLDISDACIYEQRHDNPNVQYIEASKIPELMQTQGPWDMVQLLDVIEHTRTFTQLFELALKKSKKNVVVSLPNELFILDRLRMLAGQELNAHSLDRLNDPEGFKHQYIINIRKAKAILNKVAERNDFELCSEVVRPLKSKNPLIQPFLWGIRKTASTQTWSMGSVFIYSHKK